MRIDPADEGLRPDQLNSENRKPIAPLWATWEWSLALLDKGLISADIDIETRPSAIIRGGSIQQVEHVKKNDELVCHGPILRSTRARALPRNDLDKSGLTCVTLLHNAARMARETATLSTRRDGELAG